MFEIIERKMIVPNLHLLVVKTPDIVEEIQPGQFVIVHAGEGSERIPLTAADWDRETGHLSIIFMEVGTSTSKLALLQPGDKIPSVVGPLGKPLEIENFGTVLCIWRLFRYGFHLSGCKSIERER